MRTIITNNKYIIQWLQVARTDNGTLALFRELVRQITNEIRIITAAKFGLTCGH